jgi:hypothetical protein
MKRLTITLAFAAVLLVGADEDAPRRVAIERIPLSGDQIEAGSCTTRLLARSAKAENYPVRDGVGIDWTPKAGLFMSASGDPILSFEFRKDDAGPFMTLLYRHPFSAALARGFARKAAKTCFADDWNKWAAGHDEKPVKYEATDQ